MKPTPHQEFKDIKVNITNIYQTYHKCKIKLAMKKDTKINTKYFKNLSPEKVIEIMNMIYNLLDEKEKQIINNNFLIPPPAKSQPWWNKTYSKSSYYRFQKDTYQKILNYLE